MKKIICLVTCFMFTIGTFNYAGTSSVFEEYGREIADRYIGALYARKEYYNNILKDNKSSIADKTEACLELGHNINAIPGKVHIVYDIDKHVYNGNGGDNYHIQLKNGKYTFYIKNNDKYKKISIKASDIFIYERKNHLDEGMYMELKCETCNKKDSVD